VSVFSSSCDIGWAEGRLVRSRGARALPHTLAHVADLPVRELLSCVHAVADFTLDLGEVVRGYLT
jgi:acetoacetate decarboxylase